MSNTTVFPYLFFSGRCEEALDFYRDQLGAEITMLMRFSESPEPPPPGTLQEGFEDKVMHADFRIGETTLMASDGCDDRSRFEGFRLALACQSEAEVARIFAALASEGTIDMPLSPTFWSPQFGMVTDRFGVGWMVMVSAESTAAADQQRIRERKERWQSALERKDVDVNPIDQRAGLIQDPDRLEQSDAMSNGAGNGGVDP